ncbi:hypothetical protein CcCBS67573_g06010 [Chytriomyces confervae]|uniref:Uncharacterized protein n=1 Tax=Chytriomyces confervae TaxID=246404 RepID=A0A507F6S8_9FUNG|nr:hypothetical protein CcCBS67573_g06010 [Chytriomyces confervae]
MLSLLPNNVLAALFAHLDEPSEFASVSRKLNEVSKSDAARCAWIMHRDALLVRWTADTLQSRIETAAEWNKESNSQILMSRASLPGSVMDESVVAMLLDHIKHGTSSVTSSGPVIDSIETVRALWTHACVMRYSDLVITSLNDDKSTLVRRATNPNLETAVSNLSVSSASSRVQSAVFPSHTQVHTYTHPQGHTPSQTRSIASLLDTPSWLQTLFCAVAVSETQPRLIEVLLARHLHHVGPLLPQAAQLAAVRGIVGTLNLVIEHPAASSLLHDHGLDLLRTAASNGHRDLVLYLVGRGGLEEHHDALVATYRGLHVLQEASEQGQLDSASAFKGVMEAWRAADDSPQLLEMRWRMAAELACERNYAELLARLLAERTVLGLVLPSTGATTPSITVSDPTDPAINPNIVVVSADSLRVRLRMFALALANGHALLAKKLLALAVVEETDEACASIDAGAVNMLAGLGSNKAKQFAEHQHGHLVLLLKRYLITADADIAPQIGITPSEANKDWKVGVNSHRLAAVQHLCSMYPHFLESLDHDQLIQDLWTASSLGHHEAARFLIEATGVQVDWMDTASAWNLTNSTTNNPRNSDSLRIRSSDLIPPAIAMALFETLGGSWSIHNDAKTTVNSADIGALLVAAEASKEGSFLGRKLTVADYASVSRRISRDPSFFRLFHPRMIINPEDTLWTKFLEGNMDCSDSETGGVLSWMEPKAEKDDSKDAVFASEDSLNNPVTIWRSKMGLKEERENEELSFFLGLGGKMPTENVNADEIALKQAEVARQFHADY